MISMLTNMASMSASYNLNNTHSNLQKSLTRLSSGKRINSSVDDAGGLAVSMKLSAAIRRTEATKIGVSNAMSLLQVQDGALKSASSILTRMSELATLATDETKTTNDTALYQTELDALNDSISSLLAVEFNGTDVFTAGGASLGVVVTEDGGTVGITRTDLDNLVNTTISGIDLSSGSAQAISAVATLDTAIQELCDLPRDQRRRATTLELRHRYARGQPSQSGGRPRADRRCRYRQRECQPRSAKYLVSGRHCHPGAGKPIRPIRAAIDQLTKQFRNNPNGLACGPIHMPGSGTEVANINKRK